MESSARGRQSDKMKNENIIGNNADSDVQSAVRWGLPVDELRGGFYSATYFNRTREIVRRETAQGGAPLRVLMQVFQKGENTVLCGRDETLALLRSCAGRYTKPDEARERTAHARRLRDDLAWAVAGGDADAAQRFAREGAENAVRLSALWQSGWGDLTVHALPEGSVTGSWDTVMTIEGDYELFAHLESVYLGILADRSGVATKTRRVVEAAGSREIIFFGDRFKDFRTQTGDGYAAHIGGAHSVCTDAHALAWNGEAAGTMPHALIAACGGDTAEAARRFAQAFPDVPLVALVDYENDCVQTSLAVARVMGEKLRAVRVDTSEKLVDEALRRDPPAHPGDIPLTGVNRHLCEKLRKALDAHGFGHVRIIASGGMTPEKIATLTDYVDAFGVGSSLLKGGIDFTADIVEMNGAPQHKIGRGLRPNERLERVR